MGTKNCILAAIISTTSLGVEASSISQKGIILQDDSGITELCKNFNKKSGMLLEQKGICEYSIDNGISWIAIGGGIDIISAIIGIGGIFRIRTRREKIEEKESTFLTDNGSDIPWDDDTAGNNDTIKETEINIDAITEATLWMSIGKDIEAKRYLLDGLKKNPDNLRIYCKLLEIYYITKNSGKFKNFFDALTLLNTTQYDGKISENEMLQLKKWGQEIDPNNSSL